MSRDQRANDNWALLYAVDWAKRGNHGVAVVFNLVPSYLEATLRQYQFMIDGLKEGIYCANSGFVVCCPTQLFAGDSGKRLTNC